MIVTCIIRASTYLRHAAVDHRAAFCVHEYSITGKRRAIHSAAHGTWYLSRSSDTMLTVSLYLLTLLSFSLAFVALIDKRVKLRKTCEGGWDPPVIEGGWRKKE